MTELDRMNRKQHCSENTTVCILTNMLLAGKVAAQWNHERHQASSNVYL